MANSRTAWSNTPPAWARPVTNLLKELDAADRVKGAPTHDGRYQGIDLEALAARYSQRYASHQTRMQNVFAATLGLHRYVASTSPVRGKNDLHVLSRALLEGARAFMEGKKPEFNRVPGFSQKFIDAEFAFYFTREIVGRKGPMNIAGWQSFWHGILENCYTDLFVSQNDCAF